MTAGRLLCITGTTGSGKNEIAARVARHLDGEVVSLDSMKVYRGMDIGTAKPTPRQRMMAPHHLLDVLDPASENMNLRRFIDLADRVILDIQGREKQAVCVGGTAMYLTGLLYGVYEGPSRDEALRARLRTEAEVHGVPHLHARLAKLDPKTAARIDPNDMKRIERALEIIELSGDLPSDVRVGWFREPRYASDIWIVTWPREVLRERIEARVDAMFDEGWVDEVRRLVAAGGLCQEARMALGYREILTYLDDQMTEAEMRELIKIKTWQFSRRQLTWMKKFAAAKTIICTPEDEPATLALRIVAAFRDNTPT